MAGALVLLLAASPWFFLTGYRLTSSDFFIAAANLGHSAFFALLTLCSLHYGRRYLARLLTHRWHYWLLFTTVILIIGLSIELIQHQVGRYFSWEDIGFNILGAWVALAIWPSSRPALQRNRLLIQGALLAIVILEAYHAVQSF